jgi:hypothetical protein
MATLAQRLSFEGVQPVPSCIVEQRSEPRHEGVVETSILHFRGAAYNVPVVNISSRGTMIESDLEPRLGTPIHAFVRWVRDGRIGLNFGCEMILSAQ